MSELKDLSLPAPPPTYFRLPINHPANDSPANRQSMVVSLVKDFVGMMTPRGTAASHEPSQSDNHEPNSGNRQLLDQLEGIQTVCLIIVATCCLGFLFVYLKPILVPFILALVLSNVLAPIVRFLSRSPFQICPNRSGTVTFWSRLSSFHMPRWLAVFASILIVLACVLIVGIIITASVSEFVQDWKAHGYDQRTRFILNSTVGWIEGTGFGPADGDVSQFALETLPLKDLVLDLVNRFFSLSSDLFMVVLFTIYLLVAQSSDTIAYDPNSLKGTIAHHISVYVRWKVIISLATGVATAVLLKLLSVDLALVFGLLAFVFNFIPNIGSCIAMLLPIPVVVLDPRMNVARGIFAIVLPGTVHMILGNVVEPVLLGDKLDLNEIVVLMSLMLWGSLWGVMGLFLAVPLTSVMVIVAQTIGDQTNHFLFKEAVSLAKNKKKRKVASS
eukprot:c7951_g1_i1.p1 GENE.c7951_g1_i1~~c7951_g1_i1.p1  ORF type:complete len:453 (+),score=119.06 c7951_g1_i1:29-1360(+)